MTRLSMLKPDEYQKNAGIVRPGENSMRNLSLQLIHNQQMRGFPRLSKGKEAQHA